MRIHLIPNSHIDPAWLWGRHEGADEVLNTFRSACERLDENPSLTFAASSLQFYEWVRQFDHGLFDRITEKIHAGRWEVIGGWWVESDTNMPLEESLLKQAEVSRAFARKYFGIDNRVAFLPDTFGHPATLPKILSRTGFKYFIFSRPGDDEKELPANLFRWEYAGHQILTYRLKFRYSQGHSEYWGVNENEVREKLEDEEYKATPVNCFFTGIGDHGGGPTKAELRFLNDYISHQPEGDIGYSSCLRFFEEAEASPDIPLYRGDLHRHAIGCYTVLREVKTGVRHSEHALLHAQRALDMAGMDKTCLDGAWKTTLFNQFHDILPGSCTPHVTEEALAELGGVQSICQDAAYGALKSISLASKPRVLEGEFRFFNTLPFPITVPLHVESFNYYRPNAAFRDGDGKEIPIQQALPVGRAVGRRWEFTDTLPARGFKSYHFDSDTEVERPDRVLTHYISTADQAHPHSKADAVVGEALKQALGAAPAFLVLGDDTDTWGHGQHAYDKVEGRFELESSAVVSGPVADRLYQKWVYGNSILDVIYSVYRELPGLYVDLRANWREDRKILKFELPRPVAREGEVTMAAAGGLVQRQADGLEMPLHHWLWLAADNGGTAIIQDGAFACDCTSEYARITFIRSNLYAWHQPPTELNENDPQRRTDQGEHHMRLHLLHQDEAEPEALDRLASSLVEPCVLIRES